VRLSGTRREGLGSLGVREGLVISGFAAIVGCSWLMRESWWRLDAVLSIWGGLWSE
jgi:hypothetical protein